MLTEKQLKHLAALRAKHAELEKLASEEQTRPEPYDTLLQELKKQKLKVKEEIQALELLEKSDT